MEAYSGFNMLKLSSENSLSNLPFVQETNIYKIGVILSAEASTFTHGLEKELNELKSLSQ